MLVDSLKLYHSNLLCIRTNLDYLGHDKGLQFYDPNDDLETLIKNIVNAHKDALSSINTLVAGFPVIGPVIGPSKPFPHAYMQ
jgi:hypothetical protein